MNRIFLTLAIVANLTLLIAAGYGFQISSHSTTVAGIVAEMQQASDGHVGRLQDGREAALLDARHAVSMHLLIAIAASLVVLMLHSIVLTYFMGTGRWIEETTKAYAMDEKYRARNIRLKYRVIPGMVTCMTLVILTGAFGAQNNLGVASGSNWTSTVHFLLALATIGLNLAMSLTEYLAIKENGLLVADVVGEVRRIRSERGLP